MDERFYPQEPPDTPCKLYMDGSMEHSTSCHCERCLRCSMLEIDCVCDQVRAFNCDCGCLEGKLFQRQVLAKYRSKE